MKTLAFSGELSVELPQEKLKPLTVATKVAQASSALSQGPPKPRPTWHLSQSRLPARTLQESRGERPGCWFPVGVTLQASAGSSGTSPHIQQFLLCFRHGQGWEASHSLPWSLGLWAEHNQNLLLLCECSCWGLAGRGTKRRRKQPPVPHLLPGSAWGTAHPLEGRESW